ncbi:Protein of unknown function [Gryllus bimaculatus]|nr:Protein of unknown function [Gryllus bimaculatus]
MTTQSCLVSCGGGGGAEGVGRGVALFRSIAPVGRAPARAGRPMPHLALAHAARARAHVIAHFRTAHRQHLLTLAACLSTRASPGPFHVSTTSPLTPRIYFALKVSPRARLLDPQNWVSAAGVRVCELRANSESQLNWM